MILKDHLYYQDHWSTIYLGDCRSILPLLEPVDLVLTDPPYTDYETVYEWDVVNLIGLLPPIRSFIFWKGNGFPLRYSARHVWSKANRNVGDRGEQYEEIYELNGQYTGLVLRHAVIDSEMNATLNGDVFCHHPTQKPIRLITRLLKHTIGTILDPFMGSGTTLIAAKNLNRKAIGIEIEERYCEIAKRRLCQSVFDFREKDAVKDKRVQGDLLEEMGSNKQEASK